MIDNYPTLKPRANQTHLWCPADTLENYKTYHPALKTTNLYKPNDFTYQYNDHGFRCDNFTLPSDINIVFLGCSITEGIGLPLETTWSYQLLSKIRQKTNKNIPYWNLALGGIGVDTQASCLHWFSKIQNIDYVFALFPSLYRREYCFESCNVQHWNVHSRNNLEDRLFSDQHFQFYQSYRSLAIIDSIISHKSKMVCTSWDTRDTKDIYNEENLKSLNYFTEKIPNKEFARDGIHPGPSYHTTLSNFFWDRVEHLFNP